MSVVCIPLCGVARVCVCVRRRLSTRQEESDQGRHPNVRGADMVNVHTSCDKCTERAHFYSALPNNDVPTSRPLPTLLSGMRTLAHIADFFHFIPTAVD